jgi:phosphoribosylglycinamide formyltransferase 1
MAILPTTPIALAVLVSGSGTTLQNMIDQIAAGKLNAKIVVVVASRPNIGAIERAAQASIPYVIVDRRQFAGIGDFSNAIFHHAEKADLVCLAGWLSLLRIPPAFVGRVMNIHPALLPSFGGSGMYGSHVHQSVLDHGCKVSGCTVHFVDDDYDHGPIILQRTCPVAENDTPAKLAARVFEEEKIAYPDAIRLFQESRLRIENRTVHILPAGDR